LAASDSYCQRDNAPDRLALHVDIRPHAGSFIRGMGPVCLILGTYYAIACDVGGAAICFLWLALSPSLGHLVFPISGLFWAAPLGIGLGLFQFGGIGSSIGLVAGIFVLANDRGGNLLTPKLVRQLGSGCIRLAYPSRLSVFGCCSGFRMLGRRPHRASALGVIAAVRNRANTSEARIYQGTQRIDFGRNGD